MKKIVVLLLVMQSFSFAQSLNDYKYASVPSKFDFLSEKDQFNVNTYTKMFMEKYGFESYLDSDALPASFATNNCNKVFVEVINSSTFFLTRLKVVLKDCKNNVLFTSLEGKSKEKELKVAYLEALRQAFTSFIPLNHKYNGKEKPQYIEQKVAIVTQDIPKEVVSNSLYAQPISNGFQLVNSEPKVVIKIYKTSVKDFYIAVRDNLNGVLFLKESNWMFEFYKEGNLVSEKIDVKF